MKIAHWIVACSLIAGASLATSANAHPRGWHHPHCSTTWVHHHKVRRCR
jgi:hypothetical protein